MKFAEIQCGFILSLVLCVCLTKAHDVHNMFSQSQDERPDKTKEYQQKVNEDALKYVKIPGKDNRVDAATKETMTVEYQTVLISYRKLVQHWLKKFPSKDRQNYQFLIDISSKQLERLEKFASSTNTDPKTALKEVHAITELLQRMVRSIEEEIPFHHDGLTWSAWFRSFDINNVAKTVLVVAGAGAISFISIHNHLRKGRWVTSLLIFAFVVSFLMNWYSLYLEAQAEIDEILMTKMPKHCLGHPKSMFESFKEKISGYIALPSNECRKHYRAALGGAHLQATPMKALSMTIVDLFLTPLGPLGEGLSKFFAGTMMHVPVLMWPVIIGIIAIVFVLIVLICSKDELSAGYGLFAAKKSRPALPARNDGDNNGRTAIAATKEESIGGQPAITAVKEENTGVPAAIAAIKEEKNDDHVMIAAVKEENSDDHEMIFVKTEEITESTITQRKPPSPGFRAEFLPE